MATANLTDTDVRVRTEVERQFEWDPAVDASAWLQRDAAERAATAAPGITRVENRIAVEPTWQSPEDPTDEIC